MTILLNHLRHRAQVVVVILFIWASAHYLIAIPAMADGGSGSAGTSYGGAGGNDTVTGTGGAGGAGGYYGGGAGGGSGAIGGAGGAGYKDYGAGGAGGSSAGASGSAGEDNDYGGGGGGGGAHGYVSAAMPTTAVTGGDGGNGGDGGGANGYYTDGGGGGAGGYGAVVTGSGDLGTSSFATTGGNGGAGGDGFYGGNGGSGGIGLYLSSASGATFTVDTAVTGGAGGAGGTGYHSGSAGAGGVGIVGRDLTITMGANGSVTGGLDGDGSNRANAITFTGGDNTLTFTNATSGLTGNIAVTGSLTLNQSDTDTTVSNVITGTGSVIKTGSATITLTGTNTYTGDTTIEAGTLSVSSDSNLGVSSGSLALDGGTLLTTGSFTTNRSVALDSGGGSFDTDGNSLTMAGTISGTGSLTKTGTGTLIVTNINTYTGGTTVSAGTLAAGAANTFSSASAVTLSSGTTLDLNNYSQSIGGLSGSGSVTLGAGSLTVDQTSSTEYSGIISGTGSLTKTGAGVLTLTGANTYTGGTTVSAGTLQGDSTSLQGVIINYNSVVFDQASAGTYSDIMSGTGSLTKSGSGTLTLTGANTYSGGTTIEAGTLNVSSDSNLGASSGSLAFEGGTLFTTASFTSSRSIALDSGGGAFDTDGNSLTLAGAISGTGSLTKSGSGTLILSGANTYSGGTTVSAGTLQGDATSLQGAIANNSSVVFDQASDGTYSYIMSGTGSLTKSGSGKLNLINANTYTGDTAIKEGTLAINGSITSSVTVDSSGTLMGSGTITGDVTNNGIIAPGNSIGTLTIAGDYIGNSGSVYEVEITPRGLSDAINVTGDATINGGTVSVLAENGTYSNHGSYTILSAETVTGVYSNITTDLAFLDPSLSYDAHSVSLVFDRNEVSFSDVSDISNQHTVASCLDNIESTASGDMAVVMASIYNLTDAGARDALNRMGGLIHTTTEGVTLAGLDRYIGSVVGSMEDLATEDSLRTTLNDAIMVASNTDTASDAGSGIAGERKDWNLWTRGYGYWGNRDGSDISSRYGYHAGGLAAGMERDMTKEIIAGLSLGFSKARVEMDDLSDSIDISGMQASIYGAYRGTGWYARGLLAYGRNSYQTEREIVFESINRTAGADYDGCTMTGYIEGGYLLKTDVMDMIPLISLQATGFERDGFTETGAGSLNLIADEDSGTDITGAIGIKVRKAFSTEKGIITPECKLRWEHGLDGEGGSVRAAFTGYESERFNVKGEDTRSNIASLGLGAAWQAMANLKIEINYEGEFASDSTDHGATLGLDYRW